MPAKYSATNCSKRIAFSGDHQIVFEETIKGTFAQRIFSLFRNYDHPVVGGLDSLFRIVVLKQLHTDLFPEVGLFQIIKRRFSSL